MALCDLIQTRYADSQGWCPCSGQITSHDPYSQQTQESMLVHRPRRWPSICQCLLLAGALCSSYTQKPIQLTDLCAQTTRHDSFSSCSLIDTCASFNLMTRVFVCCPRLRSNTNTRRLIHRSWRNGYYLNRSGQHSKLETTSSQSWVDVLYLINEVVIRRMTTSWVTLTLTSTVQSWLPLAVFWYVLAEKQIRLWHIIYLQSIGWSALQLYKGKVTPLVHHTFDEA